MMLAMSSHAGPHGAGAANGTSSGSSASPFASVAIRSARKPAIPAAAAAKRVIVSSAAVQRRIVPRLASGGALPRMRAAGNSTAPENAGPP